MRHVYCITSVQDSTETSVQYNSGRNDRARSYVATVEGNETHMFMFYFQGGFDLCIGSVIDDLSIIAARREKLACEERRCVPFPRHWESLYHYFLGLDFIPFWLMTRYKDPSFSGPMMCYNKRLLLRD